MTSGTLKDKVYASVLRSIIEGEYTIESRISEKQLAEKNEVSKAPVREALVQLCAQGILRSEPRSGYRLVNYSDKNIRNILEYRVMLECGCLQVSFDKITETQLLRLESILEGEFLRLSDGDPKDYWNQTLDFHLTLASFAENEFIYNRLNAALYTSMLAYLQNYRQEWQEAFNPESAKESGVSGRKPSVTHREIVQCIRSKDKGKAIEMLRKDIHTFLMPEEEYITKENRNNG